MLKINEVKQLYLGVQGESQEHTITIDVNPWLVEHPNGTVSIWHRRNGDEAPTPTGAVLDRDSGVLSWTLTGLDTYVAGDGMAEIRLTENSVIKKTREVITTVSESVTGAGGVPGSGWQDYINIVEGYKNAAETAQNAAEDARDLAHEWATYGESSEEPSATNNAKYWSEQAEAAQGLAEEAQGKAEAAQGLAEEAQGKAEDAQEAAETAQGLAETAQGNAEDSAEDAEAWAIGKRGGVDVPSTDPTYHNNAKFYDGEANTAAWNANSCVRLAQTAQGKAETAQGLAEDAQGAAEDARDLAHEWATYGESSETPSATNNAKYWAEQAEDSADDAAQAVQDAIDDTAGDGDTDKLWSANKIYDELALKATKETVMGIFNHATQYTPSNDPMFFYGEWYHEVGTSYIARLNDSHAPADPELVSVWQVMGDAPYHIPSSSNYNWLVYTFADAMEHINDFQNNIADIFYSGVVYEEGHYVNRDGVTYKRKSWGSTTPVAKAWSASDWEKVEVANDLNEKIDSECSALKSALFKSIHSTATNIISVSDFTQVSPSSGVSISVDSENGTVTVSATTSKQYACGQTPDTFIPSNLIVGRTYRIHVKANTISGNPDIRLAIRGKQGNADQIAVNVALGNGGENFIEFVADEYMKRVALFVTMATSTTASVMFSDIWLEEYNTAGIDYSARSSIASLDSELSDFEENTFDVIPPTDYGALIKASDCYATKTGITISDTDNGILLDKTARDNMSVYFYFNDLPTATAANPVTYDFSITVSDTTGIDAVYFYDGSTQVGSYAGGTIQKDGNKYSFSYTYQNQSTLRWQIGLLYSFQSTKTITSIIGVVQGATTAYHIIPDTVDWYFDNKYGAKFDAPNGGIKEIKTFNALWSQGACAVGDYYAGFSAGADDHSTNGKITIGLFSDIPNNTEQVNHNLGHCASADYNEMTDTMLIGNGTTDTTILPCIYLVKNASNVVENKTDIEYDGDNVVAIDLSDLDGVGCVACFGENEQIVYVVTVDAETTMFSEKNKKYIYRCFMGLGDNNLVSSYQSDSYGQFISGCASNEYNGTLRILNSYEIAFPGELQGLKYVNGNLLFPMDNYNNHTMSNYLTSYLVYVKLSDSPVIEKILWIPEMGSDGGLVKTECEDVIFHDGIGYVMTNTTVGSAHTYKTHVFRE